ncbi:hypothetical protein AAG906_026924 [Vitis piasezkii]
MSVVKAILSHSIEDAFNVVETSYTEVLVSHARLFINLGQLQWRELFPDGDDGEASAFTRSILHNEWSEFVERSIEAGIGGPVTSMVKERPLVKMVIDELEAMTAMDDLAEKKG